MFLDADRAAIRPGWPPGRSIFDAGSRAVGVEPGPRAGFAAAAEENLHTKKKIKALSRKHEALTIFAASYARNEMDISTPSRKTSIRVPGQSPRRDIHPHCRTAASPSVPPVGFAHRRAAARRRHWRSD